MGGAGSQGAHLPATCSRQLLEGKSHFPLEVWPLVGAPATVHDSTLTHIHAELILSQVIKGGKEGMKQGGGLVGEGLEV